jgi:hypothetical protein
MLEAGYIVLRALATCDARESPALAKAGGSSRWAAGVLATSRTIPGPRPACPEAAGFKK